MNDVLEMLSHVPSFFGYFVMGLFFLCLYFLAYTRTTQYNELELIRQGNTAAAYSLIGSALGFSLPLYAAIAHAASGQAFVFWALMALVAQIGTYYFLKLALKDVDAQIESNNAAYGILEGGISVVVGVINAACVA